MEERFKRYNQKCTFFAFRFRKEKDDKYIKFLKECPDKMAFLRSAIDRELS